MGRFVPLSIPNFEGNERKYVDDALDQGWVSTGGAYITEPVSYTHLTLPTKLEV